MSKPLIVVNFKTYESAHGLAAVELAKAMEVVNTEVETCELVAVVSAFDLASVSAAAPTLSVWTQHLDPVGFGSNTGWLHPSTAIQHGATGTIINHAEHKVSIEHVKELISQLPIGFPVCACAADLDEARALAALSPTMIAVEPPELIGGDISVTSADPAIVSDTVSLVNSVNPQVVTLCGAGVKNGQDVSTAIELGTSGVLLASGVTKAEDPLSVLRDLVSSL
ncbi:MAG: triose-phosphate isomerase [Candidatus Poseidoniales archaeon]|jgi:triosephosphate isomerase|tara:strand:- start:399 stop:1070 length:672 start_codon:yes stop_codon:yes gene_type:complete